MKAICSRGGFIAQSVEHRTGITEVMGSNPVEASDFFLGFLCNCLSYFTTAKITFTCIDKISYTSIIPTIAISYKASGSTLDSHNCSMFL